MITIGYIARPPTPKRTATATRSSGWVVTRQMELGRKFLGLLELSVVLAALGHTKPALAFRTAGESTEIQSAAPVRWRYGQFRFALNTQVPSTFFVSDYESTVRDAISVWSSPGCTVFTSMYLGQTDVPAQPGDGINTVQWISGGWAARGYDPTAPAFTDVKYEHQPDGSWQITEADIYLNGENSSWTLKAEPNSTQLSVWNVILHETGHAVGLDHPCENSATAGLPSCHSDSAFDSVVMNPDYNAERVALSADDIAGVCWLYSAGGACGSSSCGSMSVCSGDGCHDPCGSLLCASNQSCVSGTCVDDSNLQTDGGVPIGLVADVGQYCSSSIGCRRGLSCIDGLCKGGPLLNGDPCDKDVQCDSGICLAHGYCAHGCRDALECPDPDSECTDINQSYGGCVSALAPMGAACSSSLDCLGNQCLTEDNRTPICTRLCGDANQACPADWQCNEFEGRKVCSYGEPLDGGCVCRTGLRGRDSDGFCVASGLAALLIAARRRQQTTAKSNNR